MLIPGYLLAGRPAISIDVQVAKGRPVFYEPWHLLDVLLHSSSDTQLIDTAGLIAFAVLAAILLWGLPAGPAGLLAARPTLAVTFAWLIASPQQRPWYDVMLFPLLAMMPATRLDLIVMFRAAVAALAELPGVTFFTSLRPAWLSGVGGVLSAHLVPWALTLTVVVLLLFCFTGRWTSTGPGDEIPSSRPFAGPDSS